MASSPPSPFTTPLPNSKKRPSMSSQVSQGAANKRPKLHPLRQTSFPANVEPHSYSAVASARSETGSLAPSAFSTTSASKPQPRGRGRPRKSLQIPEEDGRSIREGATQSGKGRGGQAKSVVSAARSGVNAEDEADDDDDDEPDYMEHGGDESEQKREEERVNIFTGQLTAEQSKRYLYYRTGGLRDNVVKRIVNQTVSQSVTNSGIMAVRFFTKAFAVEIIERAREVQAEWVKAAQGDIDLEKKKRLRKWQAKQKELEEKEQALKKDDADAVMPEQERRAFQQEIQRLKESAQKYIPNKHNAGLLPDHLREALRRYKADGDGNGFGFDGLSHPLLGVHGATSWRIGDGATGQRLFR